VVKDLQSQVRHAHLVNIRKGKGKRNIHDAGIFPDRIDFFSHIPAGPLNPGKPLAVQHGLDS
jgi:hypothetical protein